MIPGMEDMHTFARNADAMRQSLGWTKARLADRSHVPHSYMRKLLTGERNTTVRTASDIASALGVPLSALFSKNFDPAVFSGVESAGG